MDFIGSPTAENYQADNYINCYYFYRFNVYLIILSRYLLL
jgi:hypothetical protein